MSDEACTTAGVRVRWLVEHIAMNATRELAYGADAAGLLFIRETWISDVYVCPLFIPKEIFEYGVEPKCAAKAEGR